VNPKNFFAELKRRNVYKVAIAYAVVAWLLMQVASQIFPFFEIPNWAVRLVVLLLVIGFPVAMILAWAFELTPEGIKRAEDVDLSKPITRKTGRKLDFSIIAVLLLAIGILLFQRLHPTVSPAVSSSLEKSIADQLQAKLSPTEKSAMNERPTSDMVAYDLYLRAKELIYDSVVYPARARENYFKAVQLLDQSVARDGAFLLAHYQLAYAHDQ